MTRQPIRPADTSGAGLSWAVTAGKLLTLAAADNYTLTVPATGTVPLLGANNAFTGTNTISILGVGTTNPKANFQFGRSMAFTDWSPSGDNGIGLNVVYNGGYRGIVAGRTSLLRFHDGSHGGLSLNYMTGDDTTTTDQLITNMTSKLAVMTNGKVGLGTLSPDGSLSISTTPLLADTVAGASITLRRQDNSLYASAIYHALQSGFDCMTFGVSSGSGGSLAASNVKMVLQQGGRIGIGTTLPSSRLDIFNNATTPAPTLGYTSGILSMSGDSQSYGLDIGVINNGNAWLQAHRFDTNPTAYDLLLQPSGGRVGIGVPVPSGKFHVRGAYGESFYWEVETSGATSYSIAAGVRRSRIIGSMKERDAPTYNNDVDLSIGYNTMITIATSVGQEVAFSTDSAGNLYVSKYLGTNVTRIALWITTIRD